MWDLFMYVGLGVCGYFLYCGVQNKPFFPWIKKSNKKKIVPERESLKQARIIEGPFHELMGIKEHYGNLLELKSEIRGVRKFSGAVRCEPINYDLRSFEEQQETDMAYEHLLASVSLGPGREVKLGTHIQSRPIELVDEMQTYQENFHNLDPVAQRYAEEMFFPYIEGWQKTVEEYDYTRYILVILEYTDKMIGHMDEESILLKAKNEFGRLAGNIGSNYSRMGGYSEVCQEMDLYEAIYFATHKKNASIRHFRSIMSQDNPLSTVVMSNYEKDAYRYLSEEEEVEIED
ncbi:hypothetical protein [Paenibacillus tepidiphilus]|uniref:hypothetical protein n=1 Tax=Paenibacillus tepidiphilus TaxID=2608683 RepID=UPI00123B0E0D|nr:hypothetical protein [Paenibacillus tepidiphilus]